MKTKKTETVPEPPPVEEIQLTNELNYETIDQSSLYTFVHNEIEYLRDDDYNLYCCDSLEKVGRFENDNVIEF